MWNFQYIYIILYIVVFRVNNIRREGRDSNVAYTEYVEVSVHDHVVRMGLNGEVIVSNNNPLSN